MNNPKVRSRLSLSHYSKMGSVYIGIGKERMVMSEFAKKKATYEDLYDVPENMIGEIIDGELIVTPRPGPKHVRTASVLGGKIMPPYDLGEGGGPGGWILLDEVEVKLGEISSIRALPVGGRRGFQRNWHTTGFPLLRIGYAKSSHQEPSAMTKSEKCPSMLAMV